MTSHSAILFENCTDELHTVVEEEPCRLLTTCSRGLENICVAI